MAEDGLDYTVAIIQGRGGFGEGSWLTLGAGREVGIAAISTATARVSVGVNVLILGGFDTGNSQVRHKLTRQR